MYLFSDSIYGDYHCEVSSVILWLKWFVWIIHDNSCISFTWQVLWVQSHFSLTKVKMMPVLSYCSSLEYSLHCANNTKMKPKERTTSGIINQSSFVRIFQLYFFYPNIHENNFIVYIIGFIPWKVHNFFFIIKISTQN